jgi:sirohydrochlorin cobaltochelatase
MALVEGIPIAAFAPGRPVRAGAIEGLLLVAHGSVCARSALEVRALANLVGRALPDVAVDVGYLEMSDPPAGAVVDRLAGAGCRRVAVVPLMLLGAGHAKSDVPAVVHEARRRHRDVEFPFGAPLGVGRAPVELLGNAVVASGGAGLPLLLIARGTSDPDANAEACKAGRLVAEWTGAPFAYVGFSGVAGPTVPEAADVFSRLGFARVVVAWWFLCHGKLIERGRDDLARFSARTRVEIVDAGHLGPHPALVPLVVERYQQALAGIAVVNCDTCAYRAPWPGREDRVGQAIGVGHSHLAVEHRHHAGGAGHRH